MINMEEYLVYIFPPIFAGVGFLVRFIWDFYINRRKRELQEKIKIVEYRLKEFYYPIFFFLKREQIIWEKILKLKEQNFIEQTEISISIDNNPINNITSMINKHFSFPIRSHFTPRQLSYLSSRCREPQLELHQQPQVENQVEPQQQPQQQPQQPQVENQVENQQETSHQPQVENQVETSQQPQVENQVETSQQPHHDKLIKALDEENLKIHKIVQTVIHEKISIALPPKHLVELLMQYDEHVTVYQMLRDMNIYDKFPKEYDAPYPHNIIKEVEKRIDELNKEYINYNKKL